MNSQEIYVDTHSKVSSFHCYVGMKANIVNLSVKIKINLWN